MGPSSYPKLAVQEFTIHGAELISYVRFIRVVGYLQVRLHMLGKLEELQLAKFF